MTSPRPRIVVLGAGVAGLEAALLLQKRLSGRVDLQVICDGDDFLLRPNLAYVPFDADPAASSLYIDETLGRAGIQRTLGRVEGVDTDLGRVCLVGGRYVPYEHLVIATGAAHGRAPCPGSGSTR